MIMNRVIMKDWIIEALNHLGGKGWPREVSKYIWERYETDLKNSGDRLYTWQYDVRWAAQSLRKEGVLKPVNNRRDLPWELA